MEYINVQYVKMPGRIHGAIVANEDGGCTVFLDPNDPDDVQRDALRHELRHIENGDLDDIQDKHIQILEAYAHYGR